MCASPVAAPTAILAQPYRESSGRPRIAGMRESGTQSRWNAPAAARPRMARGLRCAARCRPARRISGEACPLTRSGGVPVRRSGYPRKKTLMDLRLEDLFAREQIVEIAALVG